MILVFGSINIDLLVPVSELPGRGETVLGGDYRLLPGGKGANQALAACRAGAAVVMAGAVGDDAFAGAALELLKQDGVDFALVRRVNRPTGCAAIMVGGAGENLIAVAPGANAEAVASAVPDEVLGPGTIVLCQMRPGLAGMARALVPSAQARPLRMSTAPSTPKVGISLPVVALISWMKLSITKISRRSLPSALSQKFIPLFWMPVIPSWTQISLPVDASSATIDELLRP